MDTIYDLYFINNFMANDYDFVVNLAYKLDFKIKYGEMIISLAGKICVRIDLNRQFGIYTYPHNFGNNAHRLFVICVEYARMPVEAREEEEKFYLQKMRSFYDRYYDETAKFLNIFKDKYFMLSNLKQGDYYKTQFTQKEIDKIKEEQHTDLSEFKQIPVEEIEDEL